MRRLFWTAVGAAGGIYAYRRSQRAVQEARQRGVVGNVQAASGAASTLSAQLRQLATVAGPLLTAAAGGAAAATANDAVSGRSATAGSGRVAPVSPLTAATGAAAAKVLADAAARITAGRTITPADPGSSQQTRVTVTRADQYPSSTTPGSGRGRS